MRIAILEDDPDQLALLKRWVAADGHDVHGWSLGTNRGPTGRVVAQLRARLDRLHHESGRTVHALVGRMPRLEELYLFAHSVDGGALFALPMPNLRVLQVYHSHDYPLERLAETQ